MKCTFFHIIILLLATIAVPAQPREKKDRTVVLTLHPAKVSEAAKKYRLLPKAEEQIDADAAPLYQKAAQSLPENLKKNLIHKWARNPLEELPRKQVESTLQQLKPTLQLIEQAAKCKHCNWPEIEDGEVTDKATTDLSKFRQIANILALQARLQIAQGQYDKAIGTIQAGFAMSTNLGKAPVIVQGLVGIATAAVVCKQLEEYVQGQDAPNLYWALQNLPKPVIDLTEQLVLESPNIRKKIHMLMNRLDRHVAALQCVEAIRLYAAAHNGKLPDELSSITEVSVPDGPVTKEPFLYSRIDSKAALEALIPEGGTAKDAMRYELTLKE